MNRSLRYFLLFCALLGGGVLLAWWWLGPVMSDLMFDDERRHQPLFAWYFVKATDTSAVGVADKVAAFDLLVRGEGAQVLWQGQTAQVITGGVADEWQWVSAYRFDEGAGFAAVASSSPYRDALNAAPRTRELVLVVTRPPPQPLDPARRIVLLLFVDADGDLGDRSKGLVESVAAFRGRVAWRTPVEVLAGEEPYARLVIVTFASELDFEGWLADPAAALERTLARRTHDRVVVAELAPLGPRPIPSRGAQPDG